MNTYRVIVDGNTLPGFSPDDVRQQLAALIKRSEDVAARLLGGKPSSVKSGIEEATGLRYVETLRKIGVACRLEPETIELELNSVENAGQAPVMPIYVSAAAAPIAAGRGEAAQTQPTRWRSVTYGLIASLAVVAWTLPGMLAQLIMGAFKTADAPLVLALIFGFGALPAFAIVYFVAEALGKKLRLEQNKSQAYRPSRALVVGVAISLTAIGTYSVVQSYSVGREQLDVAAKATAAAEARRQAIAATAEAEKQRVAALTPEQRAAEERAKHEQAAAAAKASATEAARKEADQAKLLADKEKHKLQMGMAGVGAQMLKRAMKDPEAFSLTSLLLMSNGTACYEYRAKNSFGAVLPSSAVLTTKGKMLTQEHDGNAFVSVWNRECTISGGEEIATIVKLSGIL